MNIRKTAVLGLTAAFLASPVISASPAFAQDAKKAAAPKVGERIGAGCFSARL
jgi:hypothetical protein